ncbi:DUF6270 domain-containing protein [Brevibacterium sp. UMB1308A]|uniref:DUF6270 domain-containing protein n=1 Tax=Brevibacterium sp. UMB1308A TaxID=3050608 RepID=UPI00254C704D|nr:DUF6270 domain-containing protein [Brevibacterium sp. UMB1308A]MDK8346574.1 DUF6270 domain-containing protein [Brevibacterium sp. UMB1308B]MDK8713483.1 DUF6270 domain-containing protein [Brevibacterium sp. UMB1308A]
MSSNEENHITVGIFGSCVSRDTCEYWAECDPRVYVARQSSICRLNPMRDYAPEASVLESEFQRRLYRGDARADAMNRLTSGNLDLIMIDLVDERRGVWVDQEGRFLTNSIEAFKIGIDEIARRRNYRLIEFGSDEHFELWTTGFALNMADLKAVEVPTVLMDVAWADTFDDERWSSHNRRKVGRLARTAKRNWANVRTSLVSGRAIWSVANDLLDRTMPDVDARHQRVAEANCSFARYFEFASTLTDFVIRRGPEEVRSARDHKWGAAPYHYDAQTYESLVDELRRIARG